MDGGDRAGYKQVAGTVDVTLVGPSTGSTAVTTCPYANGWSKLTVLSSKAAIASITAAGLINSSKITSGTSLLQNAVIACSKITAVKLSCDSTGHMILLEQKVLL